jgi:ABC-type lipoprotein release transport system permease subunit
MSILRHAWRNLWRNGRRTGITLGAVVLSTTVLILTYCLTDGLIQQAVSNATGLIVGEVQIHAPLYRAERSFYQSIKDPEAIVSQAEASGIPVAPRSYGYGLASTGKNSSGVLFWGIDPKREASAFGLARNLARGSFIKQQAGKGLVIGGKLARKLKAELGSEVVVVVQAADGSMGNDIFTVSGILKTVGGGLDSGGALMHRDDFEELFVSGGRVHQIVANTRSQMELEPLAAALAGMAPGQEVKTWQQILPAIADMLNMFDVWLFIVGLIFGLAAGLGVMNTLLMATFERMREFGIQKAIGAGPWRIVAEVSLEAGLLAILGIILGAVGHRLLLVSARDRHGSERVRGQLQRGGGGL